MDRFSHKCRQQLFLQACRQMPVPGYRPVTDTLKEGGQPMPFHLSETLLLGFLLAMNLLSFCLMGLDKRRAVKGQWRISERALLLFGFFGGSLGGLSGMFLFRHKTKHRKFTVLMPLFLVFHIALLCLPLLAGRFQGGIS